MGRVGWRGMESVTSGGHNLDRRARPNVVALYHHYKEDKKVGNRVKLGLLNTYGALSMK